MIENNKQFLEKLCLFELKPFINQWPLQTSYTQEKNEKGLYKLCENFIDQNKKNIKKIENHEKLIRGLRSNKGKHEFFDKFLELFTAVALAGKFKVKYNINTDEGSEADLTISKENKEYNIEVKNKLRTFSQKNVLRKLNSFQTKLKALLDKKFTKGLNVIEFSIRYMQHELKDLERLFKQRKFLNLFETLRYWEENTDKIIDILSKYSNDNSNVHKYFQLFKLSKNGFMLDASLCKYDVNINKNEVELKNIELPQYLDIVRTIYDDFIKKKKVDIYMIYLQSRSFKGGYPFQKTCIEKILPSLLISNLEKRPPSIIYVDCFEEIGNNNPYLWEDIKNSLHISGEVNGQILSYLMEAKQINKFR